MPAPRSLPFVCPCSEKVSLRTGNRRTIEPLGQDVDRGGLGALQSVSIDVEGDARVRMAEDRCRGTGVDAAADDKRRRRVT